MTIWDEGRYDLEKWRDDEVIFTAEGRPGGPLGRVRLALIRTDGEGEKSTWLLHRMKTDAAGRPQPDGVVVEPSEQADEGTRAGGTAADGGSPAARSVEKPPSGRETTQRDVPQQESGFSTGGAPTRDELRPMIATSSTPGIAREAARRWGSWVEVKWDGIRAIGVWDGRRLHLRARSGNDITAKYPELTRLDAGLGPEPAVVDGEIVALDEKGRPSFTRLQSRMNLSKPREIERGVPRTPVHFFLFDVLARGGTDAAALPLVERRGILEKIAENAIPPIVLPPVFDDLDAALAGAKDFGLEGVVVKDPGSTYRRGVRSESWLKVKITQTQEVVVGGIRPGRGGRSGSIGSLLLGIPGPDGLQYAGRVGSGFSDSTLAHLTELLTPLRTSQNPFVGIPAADVRDALWVRPEVVGEVEFAEFTPDGILRHSRWRGLRPDKRPDQVVLEN